jgi:hypothetical protein
MVNDACGVKRSGNKKAASADAAFPKYADDRDQPTFT